MATRDSRDVLQWFRDYARDIFQTIGRAQLIAQFNQPVNNDAQMDARTLEMVALEQAIIAEFVPAHEAFWQQALDQVNAELRSVSDGGLMPDDVWAKYLVMLNDTRDAKAYFKTAKRILLRAVQIDLYQQAQQ